MIRGRRFAAEAAVRLASLGQVAGEAIPGVTNRLQDEDPFERAHAARAACRLGASPDIAVPVLSLLLQPDEPQLCCLASLMLGELGSGARPALPALVNSIKSTNASIRLHAAEAILKIDSTDSTAARASYWPAWTATRPICGTLPPTHWARPRWTTNRRSSPCSGR